MITIDTYTATWDAAMRPSPPTTGSYVRVHESPDGRELDGFQRTLRENGLEIGSWIRYHPNLRMDVFRIERQDRPQDRRPHRRTNTKTRRKR